MWRELVGEAATQKCRRVVDGWRQTGGESAYDLSLVRAAYEPLARQGRERGAVVGAELETGVPAAEAVAEIAQRCGVAHLVYSSAVTAGSTTGVAHLDTKSRIEAHVRHLDIASTIIRPATFMELLVPPGTGLDRGHLSFLMRPDQVMQFIAVRDIGRIAAAVFGSPDRYAHRTIEIAGDALTGNDLAEHLTQAAGRTINYSRLPTTLSAQDEVIGKLEALVDDGRLAGNANLDALRAEFPFLLRFDRWLAGPGAGLLAQALRA